eukprot:TRINITY_DN3234_c0_g2_i1.p1 TRINITY_DN3234_c0_g2~~TRINITY_DN3234_c0_g2_i1.p1  ORF type:complete len:217 (+),score=32.48 TRINITY_DN3234_c0_g2_i1:23-652(+)
MAGLEDYHRFEEGFEEQQGLLEDSRQNEDAEVAEDFMPVEAAGAPERSGRSTRHHLYKITPREARSLMQDEVDLMREEAQLEEELSARALARDCEVVGDGRLVIDPCLGRIELLRAKLSLGVVLLLGVIMALWVLHSGRAWLESHLAEGSVPAAEAAVVVGFIMPACLGFFLCVLEHSEWHYVRTVSPTTQLGYTPALHKLISRCRRRV